eukprot:5249031-Pyramimonas_sp.AAC.1
MEDEEAEEPRYLDSPPTSPRSPPSDLIRTRVDGACSSPRGLRSGPRRPPQRRRRHRRRCSCFGPRAFHFPGMPRKRKRSSSSASAGRVFTWEQPSDDEDAIGDGASGLEEHLLRLYAAGSLSAKAFCIACYWATKAGAKSDSLSRYAKSPESASGEFSKHLKKHLPSAEGAPELHQITMPISSKGSRSSKVTLMAPPHEVLNAELER